MVLREKARPELESLATGEYGYEVEYFRRMLTAGAVDVLQGVHTYAQRWLLKG